MRLKRNRLTLLAFAVLWLVCFSRGWEDAAMTRRRSTLALFATLAAACVAAPGASAAIVDLAAEPSETQVYFGPARTIAVAQANAGAGSSPLDLFGGFSGSGNNQVQITITKNSGRWKFGQHESIQGISVPGRPNELQVADVTSDGNLDIMVATDGGVGIMRGAPNGSYSSFIAPTGSPVTASTGVVLANMDANTLPDMVVSTVSSIDVYLNTGSPTAPYATKTSYLIENGTSGTVGVGVGDFDGDGDRDLATTVTSTQRATVMRSEVGTFFTTPGVGLFTRPGAIEVADVGGDARPELIVAEPDRGTVAVISTANMNTYLGPIQRIATGVAPVDVLATDLDGDGRREIVTANAGSDTVSVSELGGATKSFPAGPAPSALTIANVTGDARPDVIAANDATTGITVLTNLGPPAPAPAAQAPADAKRRTASLTCAAKAKKGVVRKVECTVSLSDRDAAKSLQATLRRKGKKAVLSNATAKPGKKLSLSVPKALAPGQYLVKLTVTNSDGGKLNAQRSVTVGDPGSKRLPSR